MEAMGYWALPGPAGFVRRAAERLLVSERGMLGISAPNRRPDGFLSAIAESVRNGGGGRVFEVDASEAPFGRSIVHGLARSAGSMRQSVASVADLVTAPELAAGAFLIDGITEGEWPRWAAFLRSYGAEFEREKAELAPMVVVILPPDVIGADIGHIFGRDYHTVWRSCVSALDTRLYVSGISGVVGNDPLAERIAHEIVVALSGWDLSVADRLCRFDAAELLEPASLIEASAPAVASWGAGNTDEWDGSPFVTTPVCLGNGDTSAIERRVWSAYARVISPFVGEVLDHFGKAYATELSAHLPYVYDNGAHRREVSSVSELEIGPIYHMLKDTIPSAEASFLKGVVYLRNRIAHHRMPEASAITRLSDAWESIRFSPAAVSGWHWPRCGQELLLTDGSAEGADAEVTMRLVSRAMSMGENVSADVSNWTERALQALIRMVPADFVVRLNGQPLTSR